MISLIGDSMVKISARTSRMIGITGNSMGLIRTVFSEDWDNWQIGSSVKLKTVFSDDFETWEITGHGKTIKVQTSFNDDYERWTVSGDADGSIRTVFSRNFERWDIDVDFGDIEEDLQTAIVFIAVFTGFRSNQ